ncbi:Bug family tripartite tricarboxylate transporter substrate binding protein [Parapusillimonas sp. JC17]|uniref:Bug family tripartite tricarboxylate transporter substrate binding protein n=1 Tax=Parapusillimonas sp. JC17 TaxID=3445768 RepID=UPI003FA14DDD
MKIRRVFTQAFSRAMLAASALALATTAAAQPNAVQAYPDKPIRAISPFAAGGTTDILARLIGKEFFPASGQAMVVENISGAGGTIGAATVARAAPDGYTLEIGGISTHAMAGSLYKKLPFDPVASFEPVSMLAWATTAIAVNAQQPFQTLSELVEFAKANPGQLAYSSGGVGSINHLTMAAFAKAAGIELLHVPYRGGGPATTAVMQGEVQVFAGGTSLLLPQVEAGTVRLLAVTGPERSKLLPNIPAANETVKGFQATNWYGVLAPKGLDPALKEKIWTELDRIMKMPEIAEKMAGMGLEYPGLSSEQFKAALHEDQRRWGATIQELGISSD